MFNNCYQGKKVLITGHTGFKGTWLSLWLRQLGANVHGASLDVPSDPSHFDTIKLGNQIEDHRIDIRNSDAVGQLVRKIEPDFIFHLAAQALVRLSYENPIDTITSNAIGSANVLDALRFSQKPVVAIMITSDKAYDNVEWVWGYRETDKLGGKDPYSASKGMAELAIRSYVASFFNNDDSDVRVGSARAGNGIGGGDWALDRIVPDCMKAWSRGEVVDIRSPLATRPWQHVLEPLSGYLALGNKLSVDRKYHSEAYNFGPSADQNFPVSELINEMSKYWDKVKWRDTSHLKSKMHEAGLLKLNCDKAYIDLDWKSTLNFEETLKMTVMWYQRYYENHNSAMYDYSVSQIQEYSQRAKQCNIEWAL